MQNHFDPQLKEWFPHRILYGEEPFALLILNQPLGENALLVKKLWSSALLHVAVDGGANELKALSEDGKTLVPDLICGDFDSATPEVLNFYRKLGVKIIPTPNQDYTDFTKALRLTEQYLLENGLQVSSIVAMVKNGDRLDHIIGNLNTLYQATDITSAPVLIVGHNSLTWLLSAGQHKIHVTKEMMDSHVGLIPLGCECKNVTTTGLKWNLNQDQMKFGGLISTCNKFDGSDVVTVTTDTPLLWTMEVCLGQI